MIVIGVIVIVMFLNGGIDGNGIWLFLIDFFGDDIYYIVECIGIV